MLFSVTVKCDPPLLNLLKSNEFRRVMLYCYTSISPRNIISDSRESQFLRHFCKLSRRSSPSRWTVRPNLEVDYANRWEISRETTFVLNIFSQNALRYLQWTIFGGPHPQTRVAQGEEGGSLSSRKKFLTHNFFFSDCLNLLRYITMNHKIWESWARDVKMSNSVFWPYRCAHFRLYVINERWEFSQIWYSHHESTPVYHFSWLSGKQKKKLWGK